MSKREKMNGAEILLKLMRDQGIDFIFCSPIAVWAPLWEAIAKRKELDCNHRCDFRTVNSR